MDPKELLTRGVARVIPQKLGEEKLASGKPLRLYWGIDPTGSRIHVGHTVPMRKLQAFADAGHHVILVIGSFTAMIGDPSDRDSIRQPLTREQVEANFRTYKEQASKVLDFSTIEVRYNHEWLEKLTYRDIVEHASKFTVQQMEERAMFAERMAKDKPVSVHEFLYPLMVGYDSVVLDVDCELGGTDQEFNMLAGRTMQKAFGKREKFVLTMRLIEGTDGRKMSKTYDNCVYLDDAPADMYGKLMSLKDELIATYFECCTSVPMDEIKDMEKHMKKGANPKEFKMRLSTEIVTMYHGADAAKHAASAFASVFTKGEAPEDMPEIRAKKGSALIDVLVDARLVASKSEARRLIEQKGITLNNKVVQSTDAIVEEGVVKVGKRRFARFVLR
ncbi:MAG: tyrosyl-tRNA synthetase [Candidatus Peregrinibacteria bacterium Gr01-1014_25]|nr:MAG: tyrosyl-tRNA synthetase [Candidatus Peregrinibacteria bacterium Gr01-1014_25]